MKEVEIEALAEKAFPTLNAPQKEVENDANRINNLVRRGFVSGFKTSEERYKKYMWWKWLANNFGNMVIFTAMIVAVVCYIWDHYDQPCNMHEFRGATWFLFIGMIGGAFINGMIRKDEIDRNGEG